MTVLAPSPSRRRGTSAGGGPWSRQRQAGSTLAVLSALLMLRLPLSFILLLVVPWALILTRHAGPVTHRRAGQPSCPPLRRLLTWGLVSAALGLVLTSPGALASTGNGVAEMLAVIGAAILIFRSPDPKAAAQGTLSGLYWGAVGVWAIAVAEIVSGVKLLPLLYPGANTAGAVSRDRFLTSATYPNFNDFSVVMVVAFTGVLARLWFQPTRGPRRWAQVVVLLSSFAMIAYTGSRGALVASILAVGLLVILNIRRMHRAAAGVRAALIGGAAALVVGMAVWSSPYVQDHSTAKRGAIISNAVSMLASHPINGLFGYGSLSVYQEAARATFGDILMDPHNLFLEVWLVYGGISLVLFVFLWLWIVFRGYLPRVPAINATTAYGLVIVVLMPVLGVIPSSTLRYHVTWLFLAATALLTVTGAASRAPARQDAPRPTARATGHTCAPLP